VPETRKPFKKPRLNDMEHVISCQNPLFRAKWQ
jgi:hypothetical protein